MNFSGTQTLSGSGEVVFNDADVNALLMLNDEMTLTIGAGITLRGGSSSYYGSSIGYSNYWGGASSYTLINQGTISADAAGRTLQVNYGTLTNQGTLEAIDGGTLYINSAITNYSDGTLTGGTWSVGVDSTLRAVDANIITNAATIRLDGASSNFFSDAGTASALASFTTNAASGDFSIGNARDFATAGNFANAGNLTIGSGSTMNVAGNYYQSANAAFNTVLAGLSPTQFGRLDVTGEAVLDGTLNASPAVGFTPAVGDAFQILDFATRSGTFATVNGVNLGDGLFFRANYSPTNLTLETQVAIIVTPTAGLVTTEAGGTAQFSVVLASQPTANVTIGISSSNPAEGTISVSSLQFTPANWSVPQIVSVTGIDDLVDDGDVVYSIVTAPAISTDPAYSDVNSSDVTVTNVDDDTAGIVVSPGSGLVTTEAGGTAQFSLVLSSQPTANVTIGLSSSNPAEGTVSVSSLLFTPVNWHVRQIVTVSGVDDSVDDGDVAYAIVSAAALSNDPVYNGRKATDVALTNLDDDIAGITVDPSSGLETTEAGGTSQFSVVLNTQPTADVTVDLSSSDTTEGTVSPSSLTFTSLNWNIPRTVTVTGVDDFLVDGDVSYSILMASAISTDLKYDGLKAADVSVINLDDEATTKAFDDLYSLDEDTTLVVDAPGVLANDRYPTGQTPTAILVLAPQNGQLTFNDNGSFTFIPNKDFAGVVSFTYRISVGGTLTDTATVLLDVKEVNDPPTDILLSPTSIPENSATDSFVGDLSTDDVDANDTFIYALIEDAGGRFKLSGSRIEVANGTLLDYEAATSHVIRVRTQDAAGAPFEKTLTIGVLDVFDGPAPDLQVRNLQQTTINGLKSGESVTVQWEVANLGDAATTEAFYEQLVVRNDTTLDTLAMVTLIYDPATGGQGNIAAGGSRSRQFTLRLPDGARGTGNIAFEVTTDVFGQIAEWNSDGDQETNNTATLTAVSQLAPAADLSVTELVAEPDTFESGTMVTLHWKTTNSGDLATGTAWSERVDVRNTTTGDHLISADLPYDPMQPGNGSLAPGTSRTWSYTFQLPNADAGVGEIEVIVTSDIYNDVFEYNAEDTAETNNSATLTRNSTLAKSPDLVTSQVAAPSLTIGDPAQVTVSWTVTNDGNVATPLSTWTDQIVVSSDGVFGNGDEQVLATFVHNGALDISQSYSRSETILLPPAFEGRFHLFVYSDAGDAMFELNEVNNAAQAPDFFDVAPTSYADLVVNSVTAPTSAASGKLATVGWTVANQGIGVTEPNRWGDKVFLARDASGNDLVTLLGDFGHLGALAVGGFYTRSGEVLIPDGLEGTFFIVVITGGTYEFVHTDNNQRVSSSFPITLTSPPDLTVTDIVAPTTAMEGDHIVVTWTVKNVGTGVAPPTWTDRVRLRSVDGSGTDLVSASFSQTTALEPGTSYTRTEQFVLPQNVQGVFQAVVETGISLYEHGATDNNVLTDDTTLTVGLYPNPGPADLQRRRPLDRAGRRYGGCAVYGHQPGERRGHRTVD